MATRANITIDQGATFNTSISLTDDNGDPLDLTGYTCQGQIRTTYSSINAISFTTNLSNGSVSLFLDSNTTSSMYNSRYVYDVILTDIHNNITRVVEGIVYINPGVTKNINVPVYYTLYVANVQNTMFDGDLVYQSNGTANIVGTIYGSEIPLGYGNVAMSMNLSSNVMIIKIANATGAFAISNNYLLYDANTLANGQIISVAQTVTE